MANHRREILILSSLVVMLAAGVIWVRTSTVKATYQFVQEEREYRRLQQEIQAGRVRWLKLNSPRRLEMMARELGLGPPKIQQVLKYEPEKNAAVAVP